MSTRLDLVLQKHPEHEEGIRLLASRDPSGNLKYLDWGAKMLASGQALAPEVANILDLFHRFQGRALENPRRPHYRNHAHQVRRDLYSYSPQDLAGLRDLLLKIKRATDHKRRKRELLYRLEGAIEADTVYDSDDLIVRHIKNKQASVHYGLSTKWCISMLREGYFEDYETNNATFFFFERKVPVGDEFDKVALMVPRNGEMHETVEAFTALDRRVDMISLAKVHGSRIFDIFREIHERSKRHPPSTMFQIYSGNATEEQLESVFSKMAKSGSHEISQILQAICCNDAAPWSLLEKIIPSVIRLLAAQRLRRKRLHRRGSDKQIELAVMAALTIHPNTPNEVREGLIKKLRRCRINVDTIHRTTTQDGQLEVEYEKTTGVKFRGDGRLRRRRYPIRSLSVKALRKLAERLDRRAKRIRKQATTLQRKLAKKKKTRQ